MTTDPCSKLRPNLSRAVRWPRESALTAALRGGIIMAVLLALTGCVTE